ncbi:hypothetical protein TWF696_003195 [Orbilia brochopaga]|uniref:Uncharacterized protein n=1 Tax=Orbilia brochopaga TaxID=3140254 RepID=A0AAV9U1K1_9PEZI
MPFLEQNPDNGDMSSLQQSPDDVDVPALVARLEAATLRYRQEIEAMRQEVAVMQQEAYGMTELSELLRLDIEMTREETEELWQEIDLIELELELEQEQEAGFWNFQLIDEFILSVPKSGCKWALVNAGTWRVSGNYGLSHS